jgi:hypothetical protein
MCGHPLQCKTTFYKHNLIDQTSHKHHHHGSVHSLFYTNEPQLFISRPIVTNDQQHLFSNRHHQRIIIITLTNQQSPTILLNLLPSTTTTKYHQALTPPVSTHHQPPTRTTTLIQSTQIRNKMPQSSRYTTSPTSRTFQSILYNPSPPTSAWPATPGTPSANSKQIAAVIHSQSAYWRGRYEKGE